MKISPLSASNPYIKAQSSLNTPKLASVPQFGSQADTVSFTGDEHAHPEAADIKAQAREALENSGNVYEKAMRELSDVKPLVQEGVENGFKIFRTGDGKAVEFKKANKDETAMVMKESENIGGKASRKTLFRMDGDNIDISKVQVNAGKDKTVIIHVSDGIVGKVQEGVSKVSLPHKKALTLVDKEYVFDDGALSAYSENVRMNRSRGGEASAVHPKIYSFEDGKFLDYTEDWEAKDGSHGYHYYNNEAL